MTSMLEYLASLRQYGHEPKDIGTVRIGRTVFAAGSFRDTRTNEMRIALMPVDPKVSLLPAAYRRSSNTVFVDGTEEWFISGWHGGDRVLWLSANYYEDRKEPRKMPMSVRWEEPFSVSLNLASDEVLARINKGA